jgi:aminoglycoside 3-N-acetyltransferase
MSIIGYRDLIKALRNLDIGAGRPAIGHVSLSAFGMVQGGVETVLGALLTVCDGLIMPTFTYKTMIVPETGPPNNGVDYGSRTDLNKMAEFFHPEMPADKSMGVVAEELRQLPQSKRSRHPILSFAGINADEAITAQTIEQPLAPIAELTEADGVVLLLGTDHTVNTSIHYGEKLAGRKQFVRWALTPRGIVECPGYPGCSQGFEAIVSSLRTSLKKVFVGPTSIQAVPLQDLIETVIEMIEKDPLALLCSNAECNRCQATRAAVEAET